MLATLFPAALERATLLGLGGGSLARALLYSFPRCRVTAVEQRALVAAVARQFFELPHDQRLRVIIADAGDHLAGPRKPSDLILADLYGSDGMDPQQCQPAFLGRCRAALTCHGVLAVNLWNDDYRDSRAARAALVEAFDGMVLQLHVAGGNSISFAFAGQFPDLKRRQFFAQAQALGLSMGIPLQRLARNLWFQNSGVLQYGRPPRLAYALRTPGTKNPL